MPISKSLSFSTRTTLAVRVQAALCFALLMFGAGAHAAELTSAVTTPVGFIKHDIPGGTPGTPTQRSFFFPLTDAPAAPQGFASGRLTGVTASTMSCSSANWLAGGLSNAATPYLLRITSGAAEGTTWPVSTSSANTATTVTLTTGGVNLTTIGIQSGDRFELLPAETLASLFGTGDKLLGGATSATADSVQFWSGVSWLAFFFDSDVAHWVRVGFPDTQTFDNFLVRPDAGLLISRRAGATSLVTFGRLPNSDVRVRLNPALSSFVGLFPMTKSLAQLSLQDLPWWSSTGNSNSSDRAMIWAGATWTQFYFNNVAEHWRRIPTEQVTDTFNIQTFDRPIFIQKATPAGTADFVHQISPY